MEPASSDPAVIVDYANCMEERIGSPNGLSDEEIEEACSLVVPDRFRAASWREDQAGFCRLAQHDRPDLATIREAHTHFLSRFDGPIEDFVILGIGGSALGSRTLFSALCHPFHNELAKEDRGELPRIHVVDNVDPRQFSGLLQLLSPETAAFNVISKSGTTAETIAGFLVAQRWLKERGRDWRRQVVVTTDPPDGLGLRPPSLLWELGESEGLLRLEIPPDVGGRFSVLSSVGLFPALFMGISIEELAEGAAAMFDRCRRVTGRQNPALVMAAIHYLFFTRFPERRRNICVFMPYAQGLQHLSDWFAQLWAESLGKRVSRDGQVVEVGQTPVKALGATDQHSQLQLYQEGPHDKLMVFVEVEDFGEDILIPTVADSRIAYLSNQTLGALLTTEKKGTEMALTRSGRPNYTLRLPRVSAHTIGQTFFLLEMMTALAGEMFSIDAFDQPGVETSKRATQALMGRPGEELDRLRSELNLYRTTPKRYLS